MRNIKYNNKCKYKNCTVIKRATIGCVMSSCRNIYHLGCACLAGGELHPCNGLYCEKCLPKAIEMKKENVRWPKNNKVEYQITNNWDSGDSISNYINSNSHCWEAYPSEPSNWLFWKGDIESRTYIKQIFPGHWAWCPQIAKSGKSQEQYELVASVDIENEDWICEYTGSLTFRRYYGQKYATSVFMPENISFEDGELCIDAETCGNEARYINSVTPFTAPYIKKNATLITVWCAGQLRIGVFATTHIPKFHAIILDYNEYSNSYFKTKLTSKAEKNLKIHRPDPCVLISFKDQKLHVDPPGVVPETDSFTETIYISMAESEPEESKSAVPPRKGKINLREILETTVPMSTPEEAKIQKPTESSAQKQRSTDSDRSD